MITPTAISAVPNQRERPYDRAAALVPPKFELLQKEAEPRYDKPQPHQPQTSAIPRKKRSFRSEFLPLVTLQEPSAGFPDCYGTDMGFYIATDQTTWGITRQPSGILPK